MPVKVEVTLFRRTYRAYTPNKEEREAKAQANYDKRVEELEEPLRDLLNEFFAEHGELSEEEAISLTFKSGSRNF
jgi:hypothetical protein